jgi:hypothetical protein
VATVIIKATANQLDGAEIDGIATESSLQDLIKEVQKLGSTSAKIKLDPASKKSLDELAKSAGKAAKVMDLLSAGATNFNDKLKNMGDGVDNASGSVSKLASAGSSAATSLTDMSGEMDTLFSEMSGMTGGLSGSFAQAAGMMGKSGQGFSGAAGMAAKSVGGMASKANLYAAVIQTGIEVVGDFVTAGFEFAKFLFVGGTRLSDFTEALHESVSSLPLIGGILGIFTGVLTAVTKTLDSYVDSLETVSASGASFNNNIMMMRGAAFQTGQTMEQFASTVSANTEKFAQFGTVTEGAMKFAKVSETVRKDLRALGMSAQEVNESLPTIMSLFSQGAQGNSYTTEQMADSANNLMKEMDAMAKLTGKSRKEQADAQAKTMQEAAVRMKMAGMSETQQKALNEAMIQARAKFGESGAEMVKLRILGIAPQTEAQRNYQAVMGGAMKGMTDYTDGIINGTNVIENDAERKKKLDETTTAGQIEVMKRAKQLSTNLSVAQAGGVNTFVGSMEAIQIASQNKLKADGTMDEAAAKEKNEAARKEQETQDKTTRSLQDFDETMKKLKQTMFDDLIMPLFEKFKPTLLGFIETIKNGVTGLIKSFDNPNSFINQTLIPTLKSFGDFLITTVMPALANLGNFTMTTLVPALLQFSSFVTTTVMPALLQFSSFVTTTVWPAIKWVAEFLSNNWKPILIALGIAFAPLLAGLAATAAGFAATAAGVAFAAAPLIAGVAFAAAKFALLTAAVIAFYDFFSPLIGALWKPLVDVVGNLILNVGNLILKFTPFGILIGTLYKLFGYLYNAISPMIPSFTEVKDGIMSVYLTMKEGFYDFMASLFEKLGWLSPEFKNSAAELRKVAEASKKQKETIEEETKAREKATTEDLVAKPKTEAQPVTAGATPGATPGATASATPGAASTTSGSVRAPKAPAADSKVTSQEDLKKMGLKIKEGDVQAADSGISPRLIELAKKVQEGIPGFKLITGLNDKFHKEKSPSSRHTQGIAMDFVLNQAPSEEQGQKITEMLKSMGANFVIDEYNHPSAKATAGHFHVEVPLQAKEGGVFSGPESGFPVTMHGTEMVTPVDAGRMVMTPQQQMDKLLQEVTDSFPVDTLPKPETITTPSLTTNDNSDLLAAIRELISIQVKSVGYLNTIAENV